MAPTHPLSVHLPVEVVTLFTGFTHLGSNFVRTSSLRVGTSCVNSTSVYDHYDRFLCPWWDWSSDLKLPTLHGKDFYS